MNGATTTTTTTTITTTPPQADEETTKSEAQLQSLRASVESLRVSLGEERRRRMEVERETVVAREETERIKIKGDEKLLYIKLKLDGQKRQREENEQVHANMLHDHMVEISKHVTREEKREAAAEKMAEKIIMLERQLNDRAAVLSSKKTDDLHKEVEKLGQAHSDRAEEAAEAIERANQTTAALTDAMLDLERLRIEAKEYRISKETAQDMVKRLQGSLDTAAAQRGNAFSALDAARSDFEEATRNNEKYETLLKKQRVELETMKAKLQSAGEREVAEKQKVNKLEQMLKEMEKEVTKKMEMKCVSLSLCKFVCCLFPPAV